MRFLMNVLWAIFGGLIAMILWMIAGLLLCITIIGIPAGVQCFKFGAVSLCPFGKKIIYGGGTGRFLLNILWLLFFGWELTLAHLASALVCCVTIIGIPFGIQHFKLAKLAFMPFGSKIV